MAQPPAQTALDRALAAHQARRFGDAERAYREALASSPNDPRLLSMLGLALAQGGAHQAGLRYLAKAVEHSPKDSGLLLNLAEGLITAGDLPRAEQILRALVEAEPGHPAALSRLGDVFAQLGQDEAARDAWRAALDADPYAPGPAAKLARLAVLLGRYQEALDILAPAATKYPLHGGLRLARAEALTGLRAWAALEGVATAWVMESPTDPAGWRHAARALFETGRHRAAADALARAIGVMAAPKAADWAALGGLWLHALDIPAANDALDRAEALDPQLPELWARRALVHFYFGRFAAAEDACRRCLALAPTYVPALSLLGRMKRGNLDPAEVIALQAVVADARAMADHRIPAAFALAAAQEAGGDLDAASAAYGAAHELCLVRNQQERREFAGAAEDARFARLPRLQATPLAPAPGRPRPIFIVGMPRSGTTLLEAVLGAHSRVVACGERTVVPAIQEAWLAMEAAGQAPSAGQLATWATQALADLPTRTGADHFTDKHPLNFESVGLVHTLFPDAAILHVRRSPLETCLSIWRQEFNKLWLFTHRLEDIAGQYGRYARLMAQWERQLPGRVIHVDYEAFATDFATAAPALVERLGLAWEPQCLDFQSANRPVTTFSAVEARDPVTLRAGRAAAWGSRLEPLVAALRAAGVDPETGALL